jgi:NAD-dependent dihydropyrimidine dehydrogenase PreA subunit/flavodoxin
MIFYFTGTGNSLYVACEIAEAQGDKLYSIAALMNNNESIYHFELDDKELLGFIFPVYAWAPPKIVLEFINKLEIIVKPAADNDNKDIKLKPYIFYISTCGDEEGNTEIVIRRALAKKGLLLDSSFSIRMPNNYILGFDVDTKEIVEKKLKDAELMLKDINKAIGKRQKNIKMNIPGRLPTLKTSLINPFFNRFALNTKYFTVNDGCTGCQICEEICPLHSIKINDSGKPVWSKDCTQCLGCFYRCPVNAIQYGKKSEKKGRYHHLDIDTLERRIKEVQNNR